MPASVATTSPLLVVWIVKVSAATPPVPVLPEVPPLVLPAEPVLLPPAPADAEPRAARAAQHRPGRAAAAQAQRVARAAALRAALAPAASPLTPLRSTPRARATWWRLKLASACTSI